MANLAKDKKGNYNLFEFNLLSYLVDDWTVNAWPMCEKSRFQMLARLQTVCHCFNIYASKGV